MFDKRWGRYIVICPVLPAVILNIAAWNSPSFCDFYVSHIFPFWVETYGRFSGLFPFSIGEWMLLAAVLLVMGMIGGGVVCCWTGRRFMSRYRRYVTVCLGVAATVMLVMTLNCLILFHCSPITDFDWLGERGNGGDLSFEEDAENNGETQAEGNAEDDEETQAEGNAEDDEETQAKGNAEYGAGELAILRDYVVVSANAIAGQLPRDESGFIDADEYSHEELADRARREMSRLGEHYSRLSGYYPRPKPFYFASFFSQQYMMGYFFPFSMEANYNSQMYITNIPATMCHELSHLKGFIYEDEANLIGYLACVGSEDMLFRYSAYLSVINYLDRDFYEAIGQDAGEYRKHPAIDELVRRDNIFLTQAAWAQVESEAVLDTEMVRKISGEFVEANLTLNGVADGKVSYSRVVELLLRYYDGELW